jgi:Zinc finger, C3HC4 type (RING finger)
MDQFRMMPIIEGMITRNIFSGTEHEDVDPALDSDTRPVPEVYPVTDDDLDAYVDGLRQLTKRKRDLRPALDAVQEDLDDVCCRIDAMSKFTDKLNALFDSFPPELRTAEILATQTRLQKLTKVEIDKYLVDARHEKDELLDRRTELTGYLVSMNEAGVVAGSEAVPKNACPVCLTNAIELVCDPCGHTFCSKCSRDSNAFRAACPMCRAHVNKRIKVFFSL